MEKVKALVIQAVKFGAVGAINTILGYIIYIVCLRLLGLHYAICNVISFLITIFISYVLNSRYVFKQHEVTMKEKIVGLGKTYISYLATGLGLSSVLLVIWVELLNIPEELGPLVSLFVTVPINFILNKFWIYRKKA